MRLIDADRLQYSNEEIVDLEGFSAKFKIVYAENIESAPTVDAEPVVHAHWVSYKGNDPKWLRDDGESVFQKCSRCHTPYVRNFLNHAKYCPNCGAIMDKEVPDNE